MLSHNQLCNPVDCSCQASLSVRLSRQEYWSGLPCPPPGDLPKSGTDPRSPALQADSLSSEPPGKPMSTGVGSPSLLQRIFPTQELNQGLLHCRRILYQLSYQGSPIKANNLIKKQAADLNRYFSREDTEMASIINRQESVN